MDIRVLQRTRVRETGDGKHVVVNAYDGRKLGGPFDTPEEALQAQGRVKFDDTGSPRITPKRDPDTVQRTSSGRGGSGGGKSVA